jgi:hypothetical protein
MFERSETIPRSAKSNISGIRKVLVAALLAIDFHELAQQGPVVGSVENVGGFPGFVPVLCTILLLLGHFTIPRKGDEARNDRDVSKLFPWLAVGTPSRFIAIRTFLKVFMRPDVADA